MKRNLFKRAFNLILALVMVICSVPMPFVIAASPTVEPELPEEPESPATGDSKVFLVAAMALAAVLGIAKFGFFRREED